ncbi:hypothetical protein L1887_00032 [Cichorium endivia]|nr:hypothetical protein L1887_00032 [Cichorium endivia]
MIFVIALILCVIGDQNQTKYPQELPFSVTIHLSIHHAYQLLKSTGPERHRYKLANPRSDLELFVCKLNRKKLSNMVSLFSRFSVSRNGHRRSQTTLDEREVLPPDTEVTESSTVVGAASTTQHGIEVVVEFKPVDHPTEPLDHDQPVHCPLPEPSILNDGRIWKERVSAGVQRRTDLSVVQEGAGPPPEPGPPAIKSQRRTNRMILPSISAPEHNILKLLEESGM